MGLGWEGLVHWNEEGWRERAACRHGGRDLFFPVGNPGPSLDDAIAAKTVCRRCEARVPCLEFALASSQEAGGWGGTSEDERRHLRKRWLAERRAAS